MGSGRARAGWTRVAFGDVVRQVKDRVDPVKAGLERYVAGEHMDTDDLRIRRWGEIGAGYLGPAFHMRFRPGQVLYGSRRTYLRKVAVADFEGITANTTFVLESKDSNALLSDLLPFIMSRESFHKYSIEKSKGSVNPYVNFSDLATYEFALPPLDEQRRIAAALTYASNLKAAAHTLCQARCQVVASAAACEFKEDFFITVRLGSICSQRPQSGIYKPAMFHGRGSRVLTMKELFSNDVIHDLIDMERMEVSEKELQTFKLTSNDILFGRRSVVLEGAGRCVLVSDRLQEPTIFESSVLRLTLDPSRADPRYIFEWLRSPSGEQHLKRIVTFTTVSGVAGSDVARLCVPLPPLEVQRTIGRRLQRIRNGMNIFHDYSAYCNRLSGLLGHAMFDA